MKSKANFLELKDVLEKFLEDDRNFKTIDDIAKDLADIFMKGGKVIICGNGGSAADSMHFAEEFTGNFLKKRKALPAIALTDAAHITCVGNDFGYEEIFKRGVEAYGKNGDMLIALSTSGNSKNVLKAVDFAQSIGMKTVALLGKSGGELAKIVKTNIVVPYNKTSRIQEIHKVILHTIIKLTEGNLYERGYL